MQLSDAAAPNEGPSETIDIEAESLWMKESRRRDAEIRAGNAKLKPLYQVLRESTRVAAMSAIAPREETKEIQANPILTHNLLLPLSCCSITSAEHVGKS